LTSANLNVAQCFFSATLCSQKGATVLQGCLLQDQEHLPDTQIMEAATTIFLDWLSVEGFGIQADGHLWVLGFQYCTGHVGNISLCFEGTDT